MLNFDKTYVMVGVVLFAMYQQSLTGTIYTILSDNVPRGNRSKAGFNYKSVSAFAMAMGPLLQVGILSSGVAEDDWSPE